MSQFSHAAYGSPSVISPANEHQNTLYQASQAYGHPEAAYAHMQGSHRPPSVPRRPFAHVHPTQQQNMSPVPSQLQFVADTQQQPQQQHSVHIEEELTGAAGAIHYSGHALGAEEGQQSSYCTCSYACWET